MLKYKTDEMARFRTKYIVKYKRMCNAWNVVLILYKRYTIKTNCFDEKYLSYISILLFRVRDNARLRYLDDIKSPLSAYQYNASLTGGKIITKS